MPVIGKSSDFRRLRPCGKPKSGEYGIEKKKGQAEINLYSYIFLFLSKLADGLFSFFGFLLDRSPTCVRACCDAGICPAPPDCTDLKDSEQLVVPAQRGHGDFPNEIIWKLPAQRGCGHFPDVASAF